MSQSVAEFPQAHVVVRSKIGNIHCIPRSVFTQIANGTMSVTQLERFEDIIPTIIKEWLDKLDVPCA